MNLQTLLKDTVFPAFRAYCIILVVLLPLALATVLLKPFAPALQAGMPKKLTPATPQFWFIAVPLGLYLFWAVATVISLIGRWFKLARVFRAPYKPVEGQVFRWQSGRVGGSNYSKVLTIRVSPQGLYLACIFPFRLMHPPLLIPWSEIQAGTRRGFFGRTYSCLVLGSPPITTVILDNPKILYAARPWMEQGEAAL
jgi:hypothetical protein